MPEKTVSIIIPSYNREKLIGETLNSVLKQTYTHWEALVVDDGSEDQTCQVVKAYSAEDNRIKLIQRDRQPKGGSVCRNIGIENANGEYILFLDSDDLLAPFCLQQRVNFMKYNPDLDFAVFQMGVFNENGVLTGKTIVREFDNYLYAYLRHDLPWSITCPIWKTTFIRNYLGGYNEAYPRLQDPEFNTRALMNDNVKFKVLADSEPDCFYRSHSDKMFNVTILLTGFTLYIKEFSEKIKTRSDAAICRKQLKQCYVEAVRGFYSYYKREFHSESIKQVASIRKHALQQGIILLPTSFLTQLLLVLYSIRTSAFPGGKYILRTVMKLIKIV